MVFFYKGFDHINTTDKAEEVVAIESTEEETKTIVEIMIAEENVDGKLKAFVDREGFFEGDTYYPTNVTTIENFLIIPTERELAPGEKFAITLQNVVAGVNAELRGMVKYTIGE